MKVVILAGGLGTRISEETHLKPKPMVEIHSKPILWHLMKYYSSFGYNEFIICLGYKGYVIKEYFANYFLHMSSVTVDLKSNETSIHNTDAEPWKITLVDTGELTMTGSRILRIKDYIGADEYFHLTYGDGLSDVDINKLTDFHINSKKLATLTAVAPPGRFGALEIQENSVKKFKEKPKGDGNHINGGFFVLSNKIFEYIDNPDTCVWEEAPLKKLSSDGELNAYIHNDFWQPMDTLRDKQRLEKLWEENKAPWKNWD